MGKYRVRLVHKPGEKHPDVMDKVKEFDKHFFPGCQRDQPQDTYWWFVYSDDNDIVGYAGLRFLDKEKYGYFSRAGILEKHRLKGLHKRLIVTRIKLAKRMKWKGVITYVATHNDASMNSLVSRGFRMYTPEWKWAGTEFLYLKKEF
jgi:GNAT superfamily N-acetyltransferase